MAGQTNSIDFPKTAGGARPANSGSYDAVVARLNPGLTNLDQATYLGGTDYDVATGVAVNAGGDVYVAGTTVSTDLPGTAGGVQPANGGKGDAFAARLNSQLTTLDQATYLGGSGGDFLFALALNAGGDVYIAGAPPRPTCRAQRAAPKQPSAGVHMMRSSKGCRPTSRHRRVLSCRRFHGCRVYC